MNVGKVLEREWSVEMGSGVFVMDYGEIRWKINNDDERVFSTN